MALFSIWFSLFAAIAGAVMTTMNPSLGFADHSWIYLLGYGFLVLLIWFFGILPLAGDEVAHAKMGWLSPLFWAFVCFAWPAVGAEKICTVLANGNAIFSQLFELVIPVFVALWGIGSMWHVGAATTMDPPWPKVIGSEFKGWESGWLLLAVICTIYVNYNTYQHATDSIRLNPFVQSRADADKKLDELVATVNAQKSLDHTNNKAAVREITKVLQAFDALDKPAAGNQKKALALKNEAAALEKKGDNKGAVSKYRAAYEADPGDARNAIALAHAASSAREYDLAVKHLREALLIDPRSTEAWFALGHNYLYGHMQQPEAIAIAANYYVTGYWFSANRKTTLKHLRSQAETEPKNSPGARAARQALSKITSYQ